MHALAPARPARLQRRTARHAHSRAASRPTPARTPPQAMASATLKGRACLNVFLVVPKSEEAAMDALTASHESFMESTHSIGTDGAAPKILDYAWQKGAELNDPMDASKGESGNLLYIMTEVYAEPSDIEAHMATAGEKWPDMPKFKDAVTKYTKHMDIGSTVLTCLSDEALPCCNRRKGDPAIQMSWAVAADKEAEVDAMFASHETFMRKYHTYDLSGDDASDATKPRLTAFTISKTKQAVDPMDASKGLTGKIEYIMNETYAAPSGIAGHMAIGEGSWDGWAKMMDLMKDATFMQAGAAAVTQTLK